MITRFAPSPTGYLHLGHALAAERAFGFALAHNGQCLLRIEDIDLTRCKSEYCRAIFDDLSWLGFNWPEPARVQSQHSADYNAVIESLSAKQLIYRCFLSRKEIAAASDDAGVYRGPKTALSRDEIEARTSQGEPYAWRLSLSRARDSLGGDFERLAYSDVNFDLSQRSAIKANAHIYGDEVIARKDIGVSYHLAVTHDDYIQGVTHIVRGKDLQGLTGFHVLMQKLMGWPTPLYHHHGLVMASGDEKLSKRDGSTSLRALRDAGNSPQSILDMAKSQMSG